MITRNISKKIPLIQRLLTVESLKWLGKCMSSLKIFTSWLHFQFTDQVTLSVADLHCEILDMPLPVQIFLKIWQNRMLASTSRGNSGSATDCCLMKKTTVSSNRCCKTSLWQSNEDNHFKM